MNIVYSLFFRDFFLSTKQSKEDKIRSLDKKVVELSIVNNIFQDEEKGPEGGVCIRVVCIKVAKVVL